jgi:hypothetical protein
VLNVCECCGTKCAADLTRCPHCGATDLHEEGEMPKITVHNGPSHEGDAQPPAGFTGEWSTGEHEHPGTGQPMTAVEAPADGTDVELAGDAVVEAPESASVDDIEAEGDDIGNDAEPDAQPAAATLPRPATNASKAEWIAYAEQETGEDCDGLTKAELIELVKG